jgi:hypothetical protein
MLEATVLGSLQRGGGDTPSYLLFLLHEDETLSCESEHLLISMILYQGRSRTLPVCVADPVLEADMVPNLRRFGVESME